MSKDAQKEKLLEQMKARLQILELGGGIGEEGPGDKEKKACLTDILAAKGDMDKTAGPLAKYHTLISAEENAGGDVEADKCIIKGLQWLLADAQPAASAAGGGTPVSKSKPKQTDRDGLNPLQAKYKAYVMTGREELQSKEKKQLLSSDRLPVLMLVVNHALREQERSMDVVDEAGNQDIVTIGALTKKIGFLENILHQIMQAVTEPDNLTESCSGYRSFLLNTTAKMHDNDLNMRLIDECKNLAKLSKHDPVASKP